MAEEEKQADALEPIKSAEPAIRKIIERVLTLEKERLFQRAPHLSDEVLRIIKEEVT